jgi:hypothetical protein
MQTATVESLFVRIGKREWPVATIEEASRLFCAARDRSGRGASQTPATLIVNAEGRTLYRISYNGRVWPDLGRDWQPGDAPAFSPASYSGVSGQ